MFDMDLLADPIYLRSNESMYGLLFLETGLNRVKYNVREKHIKIFQFFLNCNVQIYRSRNIRFLTMWYAKAQISLHICAVWSEPLLVAWIFYEC